MPEDGETPSPPSPGDTFVRDAGVPNMGATANHAAAEGAPAEESVGSSSTLRDMVLSTEPKRSLDEIESPWAPERGGPKRVFRGFQKMGDIDGMPAGFDVVVGLAETAVLILDHVEEQNDGDQSDDAGQNDEDLDDDLAPLAGVGGA
ncbi:hypothetical protein [Haloferax volcanii]|uniref:Uncharacterized protein n=3 Tax=Haloferax volcanii TaxID=2246 RepID=A0A384LDA8_HALVD|nr:hypothetical protein [Haloferax volcanii]ADE04406.1 uncharacterized protein HVO_0376 [Haloferax volcanii DS2]ELY25058.1 hypothetical protein C498_16823 [Haloferax volcanii DS2]MBS8119040.1 hypothetical protein [Haloferax volcanii]MBS8124053.1 hypothetical protein [Haloferax volcanii]MBS8127922.1 hypothetical protein [Haloferax volcanii]